MKSILVGLVLVLGVGLLSACASGPKAAEGAVSIQSLAGNWVLESLGGKNSAQLVPQDAAAKKPSLDIKSDGKVSGFAGVNRLTSSLDMAALSKGEFRMAPAATTRMAGPEYANKLESEFLSALQKANGFKIDGSKLTLTDGTSEVMKFVRGS